MSMRERAGMAMSLLLGLFVGGCSPPSTFACQTDDQCLDGDRAGQCTILGYCSFEDEECESGWAYGQLAGDGLAGTCVSTGGSTGTATTTMTTLGSAGVTSGSSSSGAADDTGPIVECSVGMPCVPDDPCALSGSCDSAGACVPELWVACDAPPGPCYAPIGECQQGRCDYSALERGLPCQDGDPCTKNDSCDGTGSCESGPVCPNGNQCQDSICTPDGCMSDPVANGSSCGSEPSARCCGGNCVDISTDEEHCGGCQTQCDSDEQCESLVEHAMCPTSDPDISGRCRCENPGATCPMGQTCALDGPLPGGHCEPTSDMNCHGIGVDEVFCPNFCSY